MTTSVSQPAVSLQSVYVSYGQQCALHDVSVSCDPGEVLLLIGPNGGGKTTLLRVIAGLQPCDKGTASLFGMPAAVYARQRGIGYVPQRIAAIEAGIPANVSDVLDSACAVHCPGGKGHREHKNRIIADLQLQTLLTRPLGSLSGGERQKVFIARAFLSGAGLLLLDEPTTGVDRSSQEGLQAVLQLLQGRGVTIVLASHDPETFSSLATKVLCVDRTAEPQHPSAHPPHAPHTHVHA